MYMSEDYNSPQSPYWCLKTLIAIGLSESDPFWTCKEEPYPGGDLDPAWLPGPQQMLCNPAGGSHHFLLNPAQFVAWPMKATQAKYCKFAYSSAFAFSVPVGPRIEQIAPDSTLALSRDGGETWAVKWKCGDVKTGHALAADEQVRTVSVEWFPWGDRALSVTTTLVPPTRRWPDWHTRVHDLRVHRTLDTLHAIEGGFANSGRKYSDGRNLSTAEVVPEHARPGWEGVVVSKNATLVASRIGASGVMMQPLQGEGVTSTCYALKPDSNTNLACQRTLIPVAEHGVTTRLEPGKTLRLTESIFAVSWEANGRAKVPPGLLKQRWEDVPDIKLDLPGE